MMGTNTDPLISRDQYEPLDRPLFGESSSKDRLINLVVGTITAIMVVVTLIGAFVYPLKEPVHPIQIYFAFCILFILIAHIWLIHWYRQGDLDPKFRKMIYYNAFTLVLLCICANIIIFSRGDKT